MSSLACDRAGVERSFLIEHCADVKKDSSRMTVMNRIRNNDEKLPVHPNLAAAFR
jgi:hypothetical protein